MFLVDRAFTAVFEAIGEIFELYVPKSAASALLLR